MRDVAVVGVGMTKWGEAWDKSLREIFVEAALLALDDAGVDKIDSRCVGARSSGLFVGQEHLIGKGHVLKKAVEAGQLPSIILWGPPGSGKTTLALYYCQYHRFPLQPYQCR